MHEEQCLFEEEEMLALAIEAHALHPAFAFSLAFAPWFQLC